MSYYNKRQKYSNRRNNYSTGVQVKSLNNPFDTSNGQPKWPDGLATYSIGRRHQATSEITLNDYMIVLFPGTVNWCQVLTTHAGVEDLVEPENSTEDRVEVWANHSTNISFTYSTAADSRTEPIDTDEDLQWEIGLDGFTEWRPVQYAMHMQLINTSDRNEGWYEAVRIDKNSLVNRWGVYRGLGSPLGNGNFIMGSPHFHMGGVQPPYKIAYQMQRGYTWSQEPTYITGELQDIHNAVFQLNHIKERNDFKKITNLRGNTNGYKASNVYQRDDVITHQYVSLIHPSANQFQTILAKEPNSIQSDVPQDTQEEFVPELFFTEQLVSDAFDIIVVKVHGAYGTKLLLHSVANIEFLCAENGQFAQYQTPCEEDIQGLKNFLWIRNTRYKYPFHYLASGSHLNVVTPPYN